MMILYFVTHILWPRFQFRATLFLRDAWLSWTGIASATIKSTRMIAVTRVVIAFALAYFGIP
jgi:hypothetical protein